MSFDLPSVDENGQGIMNDVNFPGRLYVNDARHIEFRETVSFCLANRRVSNATFENILSLYPGSQMAQKALFNAIQILIGDSSRDMVVPLSLLRLFSEGMRGQVVDDIARYFEPAADGNEIILFLPSPFDFQAEVLGIGYIRSSSVGMFLMGNGAAMNRMENLLGDLTAAVQPIISRHFPNLIFEELTTHDIDRDDLGLKLARMAFWHVDRANERFTFSELSNTFIQSRAVNAMRMGCLWLYLEEDEEGTSSEEDGGEDDNYKTDEDNGDNKGDEDDQDEDDEVEDEERPAREFYADYIYTSDYQETVMYEEGGPAEQEVEAKKVPDEESVGSESQMSDALIEDGDIQNDFFGINAADAGDDEGQGEEGDGTDSPRSFNVQEVLSRMAAIDLGDEVEAFITEALQDEERDNLRLTRDHERLITAELPSNEDSVSMMENNRKIREAVSTFRHRLEQIIQSLVCFALSLDFPSGCPRPLRVFAMFCMANATEDCRSILVRLLTHPSVIPIGLQYILGLKEWAVDQFDNLAPLVPDKSNRFLTAYGGIAHCSDGDHFLYSGSATSTLDLNSRVGEAKRMMDHHRMMAKGSDEIFSLRAAGNPTCLFVHEKMAQSGSNWKFFAMFRFLLGGNDITALQKSALALFAENCMMIFLSSGKGQPTTRNPGHQALADASHRILQGLRPKNFPVPPWKGANIVLPMLQSPSSLWNLLSSRPRKVEQTPTVMSTLKDHFSTTHQPWLSWATCLRILKDHGYSTGNAGVRALVGFYTEILESHGMKYENLHQIYLRKRTTLHVGIIKVVEDMKAASRSDDGRYTFSAAKLPWGKVSEVSQSVASGDLRGKYTAEYCQSLYNDPHSVYFNQKVLDPVNWEQLRSGLPESFAYTRPRAPYPRRINDRIWTVCRHVLYDHLERKKKLVELRDGRIQLRFNDRANVTFLLKPVTQRLKRDLALDAQVDVAPEMWEDESFKLKLLSELYAGFHELGVGVSSDIVDKWKRLEELGPNWVVPLPSVEPARSAIEGTQKGGPGLAKQDAEIKGNMERLMASHVEPVSKAPPANTGTPKSQDRAGTEDDFDDGDGNGFELRGVDGSSAKTFFKLHSKHSSSLALGSNSRTTPARLPTRRKNRPRWVNNVCPDCGVVAAPGDERLQHKRTCWGRCNRCSDEGLVCELVSSISSGPANCKECDSKGIECKRPDGHELNLFEAGFCEHCFQWKRHVMRHQRYCLESSKKTCDACGKLFTADTIKRHKQDHCKGRCTNCDNKVPKAICSRPTSGKGPCTECLADGKGALCDANWREE